MTFSVHGIAVARGIAIGRAVVMGSGRADVAHYFVTPAQVESEIEVETDGEDEATAMAAIVALIEDKFGEGQ